MDKSAFLALADKELKAILEIVKQKNSDYSGGSDDALANFRMCEVVGLANAETGVLIRMMDKVQRLKSYLAKGSLEVQGETAKDAVRDIVGYSVALLAMIEEREAAASEYRVMIPAGSQINTEALSDQAGIITSWIINTNKKQSGAV